MTDPASQKLAANPEVQLRLTRVWWWAGWLLVLIVTVACLEPARYVPDLHVSDKLEHAGAYFGMTCWFGGLVRRRSYWALAVWMLSFGAAIEVAQGAMGLGRDADVRDFAADAIGVAIALTVVYVGLGNWPSRIERIVGLSREPS